MSMTRKERLMATLRGEPVDRPAVCFYELDGITQDETNPSPFNIFQDPSWKPLLTLVRERTDRIVMHSIPFSSLPSELDKMTRTNTYYDEAGSYHVISQILLPDGTVLQNHTRRDIEPDTVWTLEHFLKDEEDLEKWIELPESELGEPDYSYAHQIEASLGDSGIMMLDTGDAIAQLADLLGMENLMIFGMTEPELVTRALDKLHKKILQRVSRVAKDLPGRLWRICGPEYATAPYLPPELYKKYVLDYDKELVDAIHQYGGYARIHQHGNQRGILDYTIQTGCDALDPIEPAPQGDISLKEVKEKCGKQMVLFGNIELRDIELLSQEDFRQTVETALREGTEGEGRGFVLMPTACPLGRKLSENTLRNYEIMVEMAENWKLN